MTRALLVLATVIALAAGAGVSARAQNPPTPNPAPASPAPAVIPAQAPGVDTTTSPLAIRPGDVVKIQVWGHEELSGEFPVDENYNLLFPLVGSINVRQVTVSQLRERLNMELSQLFQRPFFTLTPMFRVAVLGEVFKPGLYSVDPTLTVFDLLALAGGPTRQANEKKLQLIRGGESVRVSLEPAAIARSTLRELGVRSGDQLVMGRATFTREDFGLLLAIVNTILLAYSIFRK
jgi:protein involved in polysaccharide export with SLBB domain